MPRCEKPHACLITLANPDRSMQLQLGQQSGHAAFTSLSTLPRKGALLADALAKLADSLVCDDLDLRIAHVVDNAVKVDFERPKRLFIVSGVLLRGLIDDVLTFFAWVTVKGICLTPIS